MRAIIVDDEPKIRKGLCGLVESQDNWEVSGCYGDAFSAIKYLADEMVDAVITDIKMPGMSGLDLIYHIREVDSGVDVVIVSGYTNFSYAQRAIELGVIRYLTKPTNPKELIGALRQIQQRREGGRPGREGERTEKGRGQSGTEAEGRAGTQAKADRWPGKEIQPGNQLVFKTQEYIGLNYNRKITLKEIADELYISPNYLCELFKRHTQQNLMEYISEYRIDRARELLMDVRYRVNDVACLVGFSDAQYFSSQFKKRVGMTPTEYRNQK